ncbi:MAG: DUF1993 domain-containing protein [Pseudomonadota bacterium]
MSIKISSVYNGILTQQFPALVTILKEAQAHAAEQGVSEQSLLDARLRDDMHPLLWQFQAVLDLAVRGSARLTGQEPPSFELDETNFADLISRIESVADELAGFDEAALDASSDKQFEIPMGPEASITLSGQDYILKFLLPNFYFHMTTAYAILRKEGVQLGKLHFLGPVTL